MYSWVTTCIMWKTRRRNKTKTMFTKSIVNYEKIIGYDFHIETENEELLCSCSRIAFWILTIWFISLYSKIPRSYQSYTHIYTHVLIHWTQRSSSKTFYWAYLVIKNTSITRKNTNLYINLFVIRNALFYLNYVSYEMKGFLTYFVACG